jgi:exosortase
VASRRALVVVVAVVAAYHYSLYSLLKGVTLQTPLAYLGLVPIIALAMGWIGMRRMPPSPSDPLSERTSATVGLGLLVTCVLAAIVLASRMALAFWEYRIDLLLLPIFVAGVVAVVYGLATLRRVLVPIVFLLLAWPVPYLPLIGDGMTASVALTTELLRWATGFIPVATAASGADGSFLVHASEPFLLAVASACSGVNSLVGFVIIGSALGWLVRGPLIGRFLWLAMGLGIIWFLNVLRIEAIFLVGFQWGREAALDVLHPIAGLVVFNVGLLAMLAVMPLFRLRLFDEAPKVAPPPTPALERDAAQGWPRGLALIVAASVIVALQGIVLMRYTPWIGSNGEVQLPQPFDVRTAGIPDWSGRYLASRDDFEIYFGDGSTFDRYAYRSTPEAAATANVPIYAEVVSTTDADALASFSVEACYNFHEFELLNETRVDVADGITANVLSFERASGSLWTALWWEWPYQVDGTTWYQRVVLLVPDVGEATIHSADGVIDSPASDAKVADAENLLASVAQSLIESHLHSAETARGG